MKVRIDVHVQPRASRTEIVGVHDTRLKIRLVSPPVDGAANAELVAFIAERIGVPKANVRVVAGGSSRRKVVEVEASSEQIVREKLGM